MRSRGAELRVGPGRRRRPGRRRGLRQGTRRAGDLAAGRTRPVGLRQLDVFEHRHDGGPLVFVPGRQVQMRAQLVARFVDAEPFVDVGRALDQDPAGRPHVHRVEVVAILHLRRVGVPQLLVQGLLARQLLVVLDPEGDVVERALAETPAARRTIRLVVQVHEAGRVAARQRQAMEVAVDADLAEAQGVDEELLRLGQLTHRQHRGVEPARRHIGADRARRPRPPGIVGLHQLEHLSRGMSGADERGAEALVDAAVQGAMLRQVSNPERQRPPGHGVGEHRHLPRAWPALAAAIGKTGGDRTGFGVGVAVVEVVDGDVPVQQHGLLDQALTQHTGEEIDIGLRRARAERDVVDACDQRVHARLPGCTLERA